MAASVGCNPLGKFLIRTASTFEQVLEKCEWSLSCIEKLRLIHLLSQFLVEFIWIDELGHDEKESGN